MDSKEVDYPVILTVFLFLAGTTILTWCFGKDILFGEGANCLAVRSKTVESWRTLSYTKWRILLAQGIIDSSGSTSLCGFLFLRH
jgi:hypothetical protein